jgi:pimeloyl-ACP methyl ester carboxylesterase
MACWVLLRGLTREAGHWGSFVGQFQQAMPTDCVVALDLAGNGELHQRLSPCRVQDMVSDCRAQLTQRKLEPPYHVLAMSLGAMVSVCWAHLHPQDIAAQVLINTSMRPFNPFYQRLLPANYATLLRMMLLGASPQVWERTLLHLTSNVGDGSVLAAWLALRQAHPVTRVNALRQLLAAARFHAPQTPPETSTLLLASAQDHLVSVACSLSLARHWSCDLRTHPSAGHDLPLDDGPWVARQVQDWISQPHFVGHIA